MTTITARIYDTAGSNWSEIPEARADETLDDFAFRLQRYARRTILAAADSYGDCNRVREVDHAYEAHVIVRAETDEEYVEYYLACTCEVDRH